MKQTFDTWLRRHANGWYSLSPLALPDLVAFGPDADSVREELREVLADELSEGRLTPDEDLHHGDWVEEVLDLDLEAVQHDRLLRVPGRFLVVRRREEKDRWQVRVPRLKLHFTIRGEEHVVPWTLARIRGHFHLNRVEQLLAQSFGRREKVESLVVTWHGAKARKEAERRKRREEALAHRPGVMDEVAVELVAAAKAGTLPHALGREEVLRQLVGILSGPTPNSVLLTGPVGVGKTALVQELAWRVAGGRVPARLRDVEVWHLSSARLMAGMKYLGQWEDRAHRVARKVRASRAVLFVDSALEVVTAGARDPAQGLAQVLLPYINSGEITVVAEATPDALRLAEQLHSSFVQSLRHLPVPPLATEAALGILGELAPRLGKPHRATFTPEAVRGAVDVLARFGEAGSMPGAGLRLLEDMARLHPRATLDAGHAITAFSKRSGFPRALIDPDAPLDVGAMRAFFAAKVVGQPGATGRMADLVMVTKAGLSDPDKPLGSFLFMGPTGVGKTESALSLAEYLFGDRERLVRFDMSEYGVPGSALRLVGGLGGEGDLTRRVREQPFCVLLFDELEKAEPGVFDVLLQVLGEGRLTDATGRTVSFRHCIVIMTSNLGARTRREIGLAEPRREDRDAHYARAAREFFRPEFINRVDALVPFGPLERKDVATIARGLLEAALGREGFARRGVTVRWEDDVLEVLLTEGYDPRYGARPMKRAIERQVIMPLSRRLALRQGAAELRLYARDGRVAVQSAAGPGGGPAPAFTPPMVDHPALVRSWLTEHRRRLGHWLDAPDAAAHSGEVEALLERVAALERAALDAAPALEGLARALERDTLDLEWRIALDGAEPELAALRVEGAAEAAHLLLDQLAAFARRRGWAVQREGGLVVEGPGAVRALRHEVGLHRLHREEGEPQVLRVRLEGEADRDEVVREVLERAGVTWDPRTGQEAPVGLDGLGAVLERFLVGRLRL